LRHSSSREAVIEIPPQPLARGNHVIRVVFAYDGGGIGKGATVKLLIDEKPAGEMSLSRTAATARCPGASGP